MEIPFTCVGFSQIQASIQEDLVIGEYSLKVGLKWRITDSVEVGGTNLK